jgi:hypothetical protein
MRNSISNAMITLTTALTMTAAVMSPVAPATAAQIHMGGFGGGGFHSGFGGGFHPGFGGGFHPGFRPGFVGFRPGFRPGFVAFRGPRFFHPGFFRNGVFINGWWGPAIVAGAAWGAGCWSYRRVYDSWGSYIGQAYVNVCS